MLTRDDIGQIRKVIREEVENEAQTIKEELGADITLSRMRVQEDIGELKDRIKNLEIRLEKTHKETKGELKLISHFLDKENMKTLKRVKSIEQHLGLSTS